METSEHSWLSLTFDNAFLSCIHPPSLTDDRYWIVYLPSISLLAFICLFFYRHMAAANGRRRRTGLPHETTGTWSVLPRETRHAVFAFLAKGPWHLPCRLVCRGWAVVLSATKAGGYASQRPWETIRRCLWCYKYENEGGEGVVLRIPVAFGYRRHCHKRYGAYRSGTGRMASVYLGRHALSKIWRFGATLEPWPGPLSGSCPRTG